MISTLVKKTIRIFSSDKAYTALNITGLSIGMACSILLGLYLEQELSYDKHNVDSENIYRVNHEIDATNNMTLHARTSHFLGPLLIRDYPQIESYVSFRRLNQTASMLKHENESLFVEDVYIADNSVFEVFSHNVIYGDPALALVSPNTIAINQTLSERLFGDTNPIGMTVTTGLLDYQITLVFADLPNNTHLKYEALIANQGALAPSADALANQRGNLWNLNSYTYLLMKDFDLTGSDEIFADFFDRMMAGSTRPGYRAQFYAEPLADIHLSSTTLSDLPRGNKYTLYAFSVVAVLVLLVACFNYINLATARAVSRSKEIGIRKLLGAEKRSLILQFLLESIFLSFLALMIAIMIVETILFGSNEINLFGTEFDSGFWLRPAVFASLALLGFVVGACAGIYPAIYLARVEFGVAQAKSDKKSSNTVRSGLVFSQFAVSIAVISATFLMFSQMRYIGDQEMGFEEQNKLVVKIQGADSIEDIQVLTQKLVSSSAIKSVSMVTGNPVTQPNFAALEALLSDGSVYNLEYDYIEVDEHFIDTIGMNLIAGRGFETGSEATLNQVVINSAAADEIGWQSSIGKTFTIGGGGPFTVIGEVSDFRSGDTHSKISPFVLYYDAPDFADQPETRRASATRELIVDIDGNAVDEALRVLTREWSVFDSVFPLQYEFLDDVIGQLYESDTQQMKLISMFSAFCILISCLGLFGLTAFTTSQKTKEIGIRKTLGAATYQILMLLFRNIFKLLIGASLVASVLAYIAISGWLEGFYYRAAINPFVFVSASLLTIGIAFITLTLQSYKTASQNPVIALRHE